MKKKSPIWFYAAIVFALPVLAFAAVSWYEQKAKPLPFYGKNENHRIEHFELINQHNEKVSLADWDNKIVVSGFFFTHCPVVCPNMTKNMKKVQEAFKNNPEIRISFFSVDPEKDNPARLSAFIQRFGIDDSRWDFLTGDKKEIYRLARNSFMIVAADGDGGPADFIHSEKFVLTDKEQKIRGFYTGTDSKEVEQLITDIKKLQ